MDLDFNMEITRVKRFRIASLAIIVALSYYLTIYLLTIYLTVRMDELKMKDETKKVFSLDEMNCQCESNRGANASIKRPSTASTCDNFASSRGGHQMVVCYAFYGAIDSPYFGGIDINAQLVALYYKNWIMRVYHNLSMTNKQNQQAVCGLWCKYHHLDFCHVHNLPPPLYDQSRVSPRVWRFFALGDPLVDRMVSRDLDSVISEREMAAVGEWLTSGKNWHFMRDHPLHAYPIMAGLWGGLNLNWSRNAKIRQSLMEESVKNQHDGSDQSTLRSVLMPIAEETDDYINHDSFTCHEKSPKKSWPWPVARQGLVDYVGAPILRYYFPITKECPVQCRPPQHRDWNYC